MNTVTDNATVKVLLIDHEDSFSYNLQEALHAAGCQVTVVRHYQDFSYLLECSERAQLVVFSPGPGHPQEYANSNSLIQTLAGTKPMLGICLGHQLFAHALAKDNGGAEVVSKCEPLHGKSTPVEFSFTELFNPTNATEQVARYHSLQVNRVPDGFEVLARANGLIMAMYHAKKKILGLQFHPESILTANGEGVLRDCLKLLTVVQEKPKEQRHADAV